MKLREAQDLEHDDAPTDEGQKMLVPLGAFVGTFLQPSYLPQTFQVSLSHQDAWVEPAQDCACQPAEVHPQQVLFGGSRHAGTTKMTRGSTRGHWMLCEAFTSMRRWTCSYAGLSPHQPGKVVYTLAKKNA